MVTVDRGAPGRGDAEGLAVPYKSRSFIVDVVAVIVLSTTCRKIRL